MSKNAFFNKGIAKESLKMINPVTVTLIGAIIFTLAVTSFYFPQGDPTKPEQINIIKVPENPQDDPAGATGAALANALIFVLITLIGGLIFIFFIKYGLGKLMEFLLAGIFGISTLSFAILIIPALLAPIFNYFTFLIPLLLGTTDNDISNNFYTLVLLISLIVALINVLGFIFIKNHYFHNTLMIIFGMSMGCIFGVFFESISLIVVLLALSLYDIYAVFRGPLKNMFERLDVGSERSKIDVEAESEPKKLEQSIYEPFNNSSNSNFNERKSSHQNDSVSVKIPRKVKNPQVSNGFTLPVYATPYITIGLGDFVFFSVLIAKGTYLALKGDFLTLPIVAVGSFYWSLILLPFIGLIFGSYLTFVLLQKYEILPALPLPIFCGLVGLFIGLLLQI